MKNKLSSKQLIEKLLKLSIKHQGFLKSLRRKTNEQPQVEISQQTLIGKEDMHDLV